MKTEDITPDHFHDFEKASPVDNDWLTEVHQSILKDMLADPDMDSMQIRTGNGLVVGRRDTEDNMILIYQVRNGYTLSKYLIKK